MMNTATETRVPTLTFSTGLRTFRVVRPASELSSMRAAARALADAGHTVSLKWTSLPAETDAVSGAIMSALTFHSEGRPVAYRLIRNYLGELVVWVIMETAPGRGYMLACYQGRVQSITASSVVAPPRLQWGMKRLRAHQPTEGATIEQDWTAV